MLSALYVFLRRSFETYWLVYLNIFLIDLDIYLHMWDSAMIVGAVVVFIFVVNTGTYQVRRNRRWEGILRQRRIEDERQKVLARLDASRGTLETDNQNRHLSLWLAQEFLRQNPPQTLQGRFEEELQGFEEGGEIGGRT